MKIEEILIEDIWEKSNFSNTLTSMRQYAPKS